MDISLSYQELDRLAKMSGIEISEQEKENFLRDIRLMLSYINEIDSLEVSDVLMTYKAINVFREDKIKPSESQLILQHAQKTSGPYFVVPKILKQN